MADHYSPKRIIEAIPNTAGIITNIAARAGCSWHTVQKYIRKYATVRAAYDEEVERTLDRAEGVVLGNINLAIRQQAHGEMADTSDARWYLSRKGKARGFAERLEIDDVNEHDIDRAIERELARLAGKRKDQDAEPAEGNGRTDPPLS